MYQPKPTKLEQLAAEKIEAKQKLLQLPPEEAQAKVNCILNPERWTFDYADCEWEPSLVAPSDNSDRDFS